ncbi:unnamed protein product [Prorocentrum cordatum]|uniref:Uncharacterized protein n=1 Tax=Prorocentrum cordatum TaxID=2364126 RepID=A0ABN9RLC2_9DINO|nr:unnamed protein product [Polarella glacialis]
MGAATAVLRAAEDTGLAACVLDSPFCSLPEVARELARGMRLKLPETMVGLMLKRIRSDIKARADVDIEGLRPIEAAPKATVPALFVVAEGDAFVQAHHTYALHDAWGGEERQLVKLGGGQGHNSVRPREFNVHAANFLREKLTGPAEKAALPESQMQSLPPVACQLSDGCSSLSTRPPSRAESESDL